VKPLSVLVARTTPRRDDGSLPGRSPSSTGSRAWGASFRELGQPHRSPTGHRFAPVMAQAFELGRQPDCK